MSTLEKQKFSPIQFFVIVGMHLVATYGVFNYFQISNIWTWLIAHQVFGIFGASLGLHRYFSHRSYEAHPFFEKFIAVVSTLCFQGGPIFWASSHRVHHKQSEKYGDPYDANKGFLWSHIGWLFYKNPNGYDYIKHLKDVADLRKNSFLNWLEINSTYLNISFLAVLYAVCYFSKNIALFYWLGPIRIVSVWHATWLINSYAHKAKFFGDKTVKSYRNSILMSFLIGGDGNHEYHHRYPAVPKHAVGTLHFDFGFYILKFLSFFKIVKLRKSSYVDNSDFKTAV